MTKSVRAPVWIAAIAVVAVGGTMAVLVQRSAFRPLRGHGIAVIRHPGPAPAATAAVTNLAPMATVTVSSTAGTSANAGEGVADGTVDANDWVTEGEKSGAWIQLTWDRAATIHEIDLFDLPDPNANVVSGMITFDDGSKIAVDALPPTGAVRRVVFPEKVVHSVMFQIDRWQGAQAGLAEIMVMGTLGK